MTKNKKTVYVGLSVDIIHEGHINILKTANKYGDITVGLLTDKAICEYTRPPQLNYREREKVIKAIRNVNKVIPQKNIDCSENILSIKPQPKNWYWCSLATIQWYKRQYRVGC